MRPEPHDYREIRGFEDYVITRRGHVYSFKTPDGRRMKTFDGNVRLCGPNGMRYMSVARLVLLAFVGKPKEDEVAWHRDGDSQNNALSNLEWRTRYKTESSGLVA